MSPQVLGHNKAWTCVEKFVSYVAVLKSKPKMEPRMGSENWPKSRLR